MIHDCKYDCILLKSIDSITTCFNLMIINFNFKIKNSNKILDSFKFILKNYQKYEINTQVNQIIII